MVELNFVPGLEDNLDLDGKLQGCKDLLCLMMSVKIGIELPMEFGQTLEFHILLNMIHILMIILEIPLSMEISSTPKENILPLDHQMPERNLEEFSFVMIVL